MKYLNFYDPIIIFKDQNIPDRSIYGLKRTLNNIF